jgi:putative tryptophan/tyrosine transport system substrate-binding protein
MRRREFIAGLAGAAAWPLAARGQQPMIPVIGYLGARSAAADAKYVEGFRQGLAENGYVVGQNVEIEFRWSEGQSHLLPAMAADLVRRRVNLIVAAAGDAPEAAKAATATVPIVFSTGGDPVELGLVRSLSPAQRQPHRRHNGETRA